jgi:hypothetical protein
MFVFGGSSGRAMNDLYELQVRMRLYFVLCMTSSIKKVFSDEMNFSTFAHAKLPSDLTTAARWRSINSSIAEQPHHRFCHVGVAYNDGLYIFGGYDVSCAILPDAAILRSYYFTNDLYLFRELKG